MLVVKRSVTIDDLELLFEWRNSSSALSVSRSSLKIDRLEHEKWFRERLKKIPSEPFWIMIADNLRVGYVRLDLFDKKENYFTVSIFIVEDFQGLGIARKMLRIALTDFDLPKGHPKFRAVIRKDNFRSIKLFSSVGFFFNSEIDELFDEYCLSVRDLKLDALHL